METLVAVINSGKVQRRTVDGKSYLVAPLSLIVPGVLNGSDGPIFYSKDENAKCVPAWDGMPLVVYHPVVNGKNVSANHPGIIQKSGIGIVKNPKLSKTGSLIAQGWFDEKKCKVVDNRVYAALVSNRPIELSTGLFIDKEPAPLGSNHNGRFYSHIAKNYVPDHLAILPDQVGACSLNDGCGVLVNKENIDLVLELIDTDVTDNGGPGSGPHSGASKAGLAASQHAKTLSNGLANEKGFKHGLKEAHAATAHANAGRFQEAHDAHKLASKKIAKGRTGWFGGNNGGKAHDAAELAHADAASHFKKLITNEEGLMDLIENGGPGSGRKKGSGVGGGQDTRDSTMASFHAKGATLAARGAGTAYSHMQASAAHGIAAKMARSAGDHGLAQKHSDAAKAHRTKSREIGASNESNRVAAASPTAAKVARLRAAAKGVTRNQSIWNKLGEMLGLVDNVKGMSTGQLSEAVRETHRKANPYQPSGSESSNSYVDEVYDDHHIFSKGGASFKQEHTIQPDGTIAMKGDPCKVKKVVKYQPVTNEGEFDLKLTANQREGLIGSLVHNCKCDDATFNEKDKELLEKMDDNSLIALVGKIPEVTANEKKEPVTNGADKVEPPKEEKVEITKEVIMNHLKGLSDEEFMSIAPKSIKETVTNSQNVINKQKAELILMLTANVKDETIKARQIAKFQEMSVADLEDMTAILSPTGNSGVKSVAHYLGAAGAPAPSPAPTRNAEEDKSTIEMMTPKRMDWVKESNLVKNRHN